MGVSYGCPSNECVVTELQPKQAKVGLCISHYYDSKRYVRIYLPCSTNKMEHLTFKSECVMQVVKHLKETGSYSVA